MGEATLRERAVYTVRDPLLQIREDRLLLRLRQPAGGDSIVEPLLRGVVKRVDETVDGLALLFRDLGERLATLQLGSQRVLPNYVLVGTSKAALESVVRYLAFDLAPRGIRVNCVSAGVVDTEALDWFPNKEQMLASVRRTPAGRLVEPEDVAAVVSFLCSPDAAMICGQTLVVDGGFSLGV